jgi:hypothetical protein
MSLTLVAAGCLGGMGNPGQGTGTGGNGGGTGGNGNGVAAPPTALQLFNQNVLPMLGACSSCHAGTATDGPLFLGTSTDQTTWYATLVGNPRIVNNQPSSSILVTHTHSTGKGTDLTTAQQKYVTDWLQQENVEHVLPPPPTAGTMLATMELAKFAKCMAQADYTASGMGDVQNQETVGDAGECWSCHGTGLYVYLSQDVNQNFAMLQVNPTLLKFVDASYNADGSFKDIVQTYRIRDRGQTAGHPPYDLTATRAAALDTFFQDTYTKYKAGNCP